VRRLGVACSDGAHVREPIAARVGAFARRLAARALVRRALDLRVVGLERVPGQGPVILAARHYHHLYDAAAIMASVPREVHVLIAVDWLGRGLGLVLMRRLAAAARWPIVWRAGAAWRPNRDGYRLGLDLLRQGRPLLIFPEGYPSIDPRGGREHLPDALAPFDPGFLVLAERAGRDVPVLPVGLWYAPRAGGGWTVWLRFGQPEVASGSGPAARRARLRAVEAAVRELSAAPPG
jgi:1-acyl-sn-glycerol-3-phosphate acyltransferase